MKGEEFITFGDIKIKKSSFKNCTIINDSVTIVRSVVEWGEKRQELKKYNENLIKFGETYIAEIEKNNQEIEQCEQKMNIHMRDSDNFWIARSDRLMCLVVTTYEDEEYKFYEGACGFDIHRKIDELRTYKRPLMRFYFSILREINRLLEENH